MKFATIALALTLAIQSDAFVPNNAGFSGTRIVHVAPASSSTLVRRHALRDLVDGTRSLTTSSPISDTNNNVSTPAAAASPELAEIMNLSAKVDGEITEKEVRALFELWNSALATGDSRIVASRYIKVCCIIIFWRVEHKSSEV